MEATEKSLNTIDATSKTGLWLSRLVLVFVSAIFIMISTRYIFHPVEASKEIGISLATASAITIIRVSMGGFPLGIALFLISRLFFNKQLLTGLSIVLILVTVLILIRVQGLATDGITNHNLKLLFPEFAILIFSAIAFFLEKRRQRISFKNNS